MQRYNIFQAIYMSFYSKSLYRDVALNWGGKSFLYLLLIVGLSWIPLVILLQLGLSFVYQMNSDKVVNQIPILQIQNGKITTPENRPYVIKDPSTNENVAVIDTSGRYQTLEEAHANFLITSTQFITQPYSNETKINQIPTDMNFTINPRIINHYIKKYLDFAWIFFFLLCAGIGYIYRLIQALVYAIVGKITANISRNPLTYGNILQIAMVAMTPAIILETILNFWNIHFPFQMLFYFFVSITYLIYGIFANKVEDEAKPHDRNI